MSTRFYWINTAADISPTADANWEIASGFSRRRLYKASNPVPSSSGNSDTETIPITTTQDILSFQLVSDPLPAQQIAGTISMVVLPTEDVATANATLAVVARVLSQDGTTSRGTIFSVFGTDTEFGVTASPATRIVNAQALTSTRIQGGDRIVVEIGARATAPTTSGSFNITGGNTMKADYALTSGLTTILNSWIEFSQNLFPNDLNNYQFIKAGDGMWVSEKLR